MIEALTSRGWYQFHKCTCGGTLSIKFKHPSKPGIIFKIKPNKNTWQYLVNNRVTAQGVGIETLKTKLDEV